MRKFYPTLIGFLVLLSFSGYGQRPAESDNLVQFNFENQLNLDYTLIGNASGEAEREAATPAPGIPAEPEWNYASGNLPPVGSRLDILDGTLFREFFPREKTNTQPQATGLPAYRGNCINPRNLGTASNVYSIILTESNQVIVDNSLNTLLFIHRNDASVLGGHSGLLRYDFSTNGGTTWTVNQGPVNPSSTNGTNAARYPNVSLYNPPNNTNPSNAYLVYTGATVGSTWNGYVTGVRKLNGTGNTETYNQAANSNTLIPRSQVQSTPGTYWSIDLVWNGTVASGYRVMKGIFNTTTNNITWSTAATLTPSFVGSPAISDFNIAFDPSGQIGWIGALTHIQGGPTAGSFYPVFWKTTNGGTTWTGPEQVDLNAFPCISNNISTGNAPTCAFDMDLTVDVNGNPHMGVAVGNGNSAYAIFFTSWHAMFDITQENGVWNAIEIDELEFGRGYFGTTSSGDSVSQDMQCQVSRTDDGTKVFFGWVESDTNAATPPNNIAPDLYAVGYDVVNRTWTTVEDFSSCNSSFNNQVLFPKFSPNVYGTSGTYEIPVVVAKLNGNGSTLSPSSFHYLDDAAFTDNDFQIPQCQANLTVNASGPLAFCQGGSVTLNAGSHDDIRWSTGATTNSITVSNAGDYIVTVRDGCCLKTDTISVVVNPRPTAGFSSTTNQFSVSFTDTSSGTPSAWIWNFGDGNTSTQQNPTHTYAAAGSYTVCLITTNTCGSDTVCRTLGISCPPTTPSFTFNRNNLAVSFFGNSSAGSVSWLWDFGDGNTSSFQNPIHTYLSPGTFNVCLTTTDSCGSDSTCQTLTVNCPTPSASFSSSVSGLIVSFTDGSSNAPNSWSWDFGDGNQSTLQNPTHTYQNNGIFTVCLTASNNCGGDTTCQQIDLLVSAEPGQELAGLQLYPNPAQDQVILEGMLGYNSSLELSLMNALGQEVRAFGRHQTAGSHFRTEFSVRGIAEGMYFLRIRDAESGATEMRRLMVR